MKRDNCDELLQLTDTIEDGIKVTLEGITGEVLNFSPADNKMSIGQLAIHCYAWAQYFLADTKPWEPVKWTCMPVEYPLTVDMVMAVIDDGLKSIRSKLTEIDDDKLELVDGKKGPGYIIYRLLIHSMVHSNQMAYIRQIKDKEWKFGSHFGDMATAIIGLKYHTDKDTSIFGF